MGVVKHEDGDEDVQKWYSLLGEVQATGNVAPEGHPKSVVVLGDSGAVRDAVVSSLLQREGDANCGRGIGIEYASAPVALDDGDKTVHLGVWNCGYGASDSSLLKMTINEDSIDHVVCAIVVDITTPWTLLEELRRWFRLLEDHVRSLDVDNADLQDKVTSRRGGSESDATMAFGMEMVVVVTRTELIERVLEDDLGYRDQHLDFIQYHLRTLCLNYGASLMYTPSAAMGELDGPARLRSQVLYTLFNDPNSLVEASVDEKVVLIVPPGWDTRHKIEPLLTHSDYTSETLFEDVIQTPPQAKVDVGQHVQPEDDQDFLGRHREQLEQAEKVGTPTVSVASSRAAKTESPRVADPSDGAPSATPTAASAAPSGQAAARDPNELASFFQGLLNKTAAKGSPAKPSPRGTPKGTPKSHSRRDSHDALGSH